MRKGMLFGYRVYRSIFDLHLGEPKEEDCFNQSLRRDTLYPLKGSYLICCECSRLCFIKEDELASKLELERTAASRGITADELRMIRGS